MQASKRFAQSWNKRDVSNICKVKRFWFRNQGDFQSYSEHGRICLLSGNFLQNQIELAELCLRNGEIGLLIADNFLQNLGKLTARWYVTSCIKVMQLVPCFTPQTERFFNCRVKLMECKVSKETHHPPQS